MPGSIFPPWTNQLWSPGQTQPAVVGLPRIDWTHPLTQKLVSYWFPLTDGSGYVDLVTGDTTKKGTGSKNLFPVGRPSPYGVGPSFTAGTHFCESTNFGPIQSWSAPYSFAVGWYQLGTMTNTGAQAGFFGLFDASGNDAFGIYSPSAGNFTWSYGNGGGGPTLAVSNNTFNVVVGAATAASVQANYWNGVTQTAGAVTSAFSGSSMRYVFNGIFADISNTTDFTNSVTFFGAAWNGRALTADEASLLYSDPYCFLLPPEAEMPALSLGVAPSLPPGNAIVDFPKGPADQIQLHSWQASYNLNLIGKDRLPTGTVPGEPVYDLPGRPPDQVQLHSWQWFYNLNLIGQDKLPAGEIAADLPPAQVRPPEQVQLRSWTWNYNLNLIGKDKLPAGEIVVDLAPSQRPPEQVQLHSWTASYNLNLIGKDQLPVGDIVVDLPRPPDQVQLRWWAYNLTLYLTPPVILPRNQFDWPLPQAPVQPPFWSQPYNAALYKVTAAGGQIRGTLLTLPPVYSVPPRLMQWDQPYNVALYSTPSADNTKIFRGHLRSLPDQPPALFQTWIWPLNINLTAAPDLTKLARQQDWPNPRQPYLIDQTWTWWYNQNLIGRDRLPAGEQVFDRPILSVTPAGTWTGSYNLNLIGQDRLPVGKQLSELPPSDYARLFQTWINTTSLALTTAPPNLYAQARQQDWPVPRGYEPDWRRDWEWWYNLNLIGKDQLPVGARSTDLPPPDIPRLLQTWVQSVNVALVSVPPQLPKNQYDWANPTQPYREPGLSSWTASYNLNLIGKDRLPFRQQDWPLTPAPLRPNELLTWIERTKLALTTQPFSQTDWPNPTQPFRQPDLASWTPSFNLNLIGKDRLPVRQQDWPNPLGHTLPTLLQAWYFARANLLPPPTFPPGKAFFDRPQLRQDAPPDEYFIGERYPIIPPFVPIIGGSYRLLSSHYLYGFYYTPNTIITEGKEVPIGWVPTLAVDPLDARAVAAYYSAGPRNVDYGDLNTYGTMYRRDYGDIPVNSPVTFWKLIPGTSSYQLQGLGIGNPPVGGG